MDYKLKYERYVNKLVKDSNDVQKANEFLMNNIKIKYAWVNFWLPEVDKNNLMSFDAFEKTVKNHRYGLKGCLKVKTSTNIEEYNYPTKDYNLLIDRVDRLGNSDPVEVNLASNLYNLLDIKSFIKRAYQLILNGKDETDVAGDLGDEAGRKLMKFCNGSWKNKLKVFNENTNIDVFLKEN